MVGDFEISRIINAPPDVIYHAWLDSKGHSAMTGSPAEASPEPGAPFTAWEGYISGHNLELEPSRRISQAWRTTEFQESDPDSLVEVLFEAVKSGTRITIRHTHLPDRDNDYRQGWIDYYFTPMKAYFTMNS